MLRNLTRVVGLFVGFFVTRALMAAARMLSRLSLGLFLGLLLASLPLTSGPLANDKFVADPVTGMAIYGYDPVAYFDQHAAVPGREDIEAVWANSYWKFSSEANRERFLDSPEIYAPLFNGYGAYSVAHGRLAEGNPLIWIIYGKKLVFFHSPEARSKWLETPQKFYEQGELVWKDLRKTLAF